MRILIAGGGIGGLTLALMLHAQGIDCTVCEAANEIKPLGVGINILPHAIAELANLDLLPQLDEIGIRTRSLTYANHLGQAIWTEPRGLAAGHDVPQFSLHRGRLHALLWHNAVVRLGGAVHSGQRLVAASQTADGVRAQFAATDGTVMEIAGDALIGADGIHSWLRATLHPDDPGIRWNGITMWRGAVDWPEFDGGDAMVIAGDEMAKLVLYPIGPGASAGTMLTNWVIYARTAAPDTKMPQRESWSRRGAAADFAHLVARLHLPFIDADRMIRATADIFEYPMCDRDPLPWWSDRRMSLLGDAAHPMYPVGSNGASQAILDARCLAGQLQALPVTEALAAYQAERLPATAALVRSNRVGGPERVIDLIAARAPQGFSRLADVAGHAELSEIVQGYARLAGFAVTSDLAHPADATAAYLTGQMHPSQAALLTAFAAESEASIATCHPVLDIAYGARPREVFDFYASKLPWRGTMAYFHAGYWQSRDKAQFRFLAPPLLARGIDVAFVNYPLCPDVTLRTLVDSARASVPAILAYVRGLGRGGAQLIACGHSAGGHLAVELALTAWPGATPIAGIIPISGVYELAPLLATSLNDKLRLDATEARAMSPLHRVVGPFPPALFMVGALETPEFRAQTKAMHEAWSSGGGQSSLLEIAGADHFSVLRALPEQLQDAAAYQRLLDLAAEASAAEGLRQVASQ